jgi:hypothetical protein
MGLKNDTARYQRDCIAVIGWWVEMDIDTRDPSDGCTADHVNFDRSRRIDKAQNCHATLSSSARDSCLLHVALKR